MVFAAVKMDCFRPKNTEVKITSDRAILRSGPEWLVYQVRPNSKGILLPYNPDTGRHELPRVADKGGPTKT